MTLRLYNSLTRKVSPLRPMKEGEVRMYTCGPTVWNYAHIGNYRTFVFEDVLRRYLEFKGYRVVQVKNITDVEDKIIKGMKQFHKSREDLTKFYEEAFLKDLESLGVERAEFYPRASENIPEMVELIKTLQKKRYAYKSEDGSYYFAISRFKRYGELSGIRASQLKAGARVKQDAYEKEQANDFALWKAWDPGDGEVFWETELGKGRPGWHIECSAMSMKYLGPSFDIHTGGKDLRFPHHENEIAQSEAATGKKYVRHWLHSEFLRINGEEMHKSSGNIVTLRQLLDKGWNSRAIRLFLMSGHYREELNLTDESLAQAEVNVERMDQFVRRLKAVGGEDASQSGRAEALTRQLLLSFERAMDEDLNVPRALAAFFGFQRSVNTLIDGGKLSAREAQAILEALRRINKVIGVVQFEEKSSLSPSLLALVHERERARKEKDFKRADEIRAELKKSGVTIQDTPSGPVWTVES